MSLVSAGTPASDPWLAATVRIAGITDEVDGVATYHLELADRPAVDSLSFRPGQFNMLYFPGVGEAAISISGDPSRQGTLDHTVRIAGRVTGELARAGVGATFGLRGPFGSAWPMEECLGRDVIIVSGGIGLAPLRPAIYELLDRSDEVGQLTLLYGARSPFGQLYSSEYGDWAARGLDVQTTVDRASPAWQGNVGVVTQLLDRMQLANPEQTAVFCCGPEVMMWYTARSAISRGIPRDRIWISLERNMNCAIGLCGHCQFGPTFVCKDGPVVRYDRVSPFLKVEGF
jgi:NAD(P)H-flavin reductase